ncbi:hypothetical protein, partial [Pediococcus acidilactici]|uniref:hypothetical protein n=1 Tax=Pediococcus acidilactici TaxID=1254 RepID=UPI001F31DA08
MCIRDSLHILFIHQAKSLRFFIKYVLRFAQFLKRFTQKSSIFDKLKYAKITLEKEFIGKIAYKCPDITRKSVNDGYWQRTDLSKICYII